MLVKDATNEHTDLSSMLWPNVKKEEKKTHYAIVWIPEKQSVTQQ